MRLVAYDLALDLIGRLRVPLATLRRHDADLAKQAYRALASVPLNIGEACGRAGRDRPPPRPAPRRGPPPHRPRRAPPRGRRAGAETPQPPPSATGCAACSTGCSGSP